LERLISDGRIHPGRIEEVIRKAEQKVEESIKEAGQRAIIRMRRARHPSRTRQCCSECSSIATAMRRNVLMHSIEAAFICGAMAAELGLNEKQARRAPWRTTSARPSPMKSRDHMR